MAFANSGLNAALIRASLAGTPRAFTTTLSDIGVQLYSNTMGDTIFENAHEGSTISVINAAPFDVASGYRVSGDSVAEVADTPSASLSGTLAVGTVTGGVFNWVWTSAAAVFGNTSPITTAGAGGVVIYDKSLGTAPAYQTVAHLKFQTVVPVSTGTITANFPTNVAALSFVSG